MFGAAVIVLRETLEAALIVGILLAAVGSITRARRWIVAGIGIGLVGAGVVAAFAEVIASALEGAGQEYFNATVLLLAAIMLAWHHIWMKSRGMELSRQLRRTGEQVSKGVASLSALLVVAALAVMREGSEVVLFLYGVAIGGADSQGILVGCVLGLTGGCILGVFTYTGLTHVPQRYFLSVTGLLLVLLAGGMASQAAGYLTQAGVLPSLTDPLWDTSALLPEHRPLGQLLHVLIGYTEKPAGVQLLFFAITVITIAVLSFVVRVRKRGDENRPTLVSVLAPVVALGLLAAGMSYDNRAFADARKVYSPIVEAGAYAFEFRGDMDFDSDPTVNHGQEYNMEFEHAPTAWWLTEFVGELQKPPGVSLRASAVEWENIFQLTEQGAHWVDVGVLIEYEHSLESDEVDAAKFAVLFEKTFGRQVVNVNLRAEHKVSLQKDTEFNLIARWRWRKSQAFEPGIELFSKSSEVGHVDTFAEQTHSIGPSVFGAKRLSGGRKLRYEAAYLVGISAAAPSRTVRFLLEYEFF